VLRDHARRARELSVNCDAWHPRQSFTGKNQRPSVALFARHPRVNKNVLELARSSTATWPHGQARRAKAQTKIQTNFEVRRPSIVAA